ncbi:uncharacterized protein LOC116214716 isoform X2 [Punica granatum]|uniref:Uncharacterized protein LOC116214716 isoform X2 n=1 Tax=Punica granatum TaxID=22663 RepID=A0A6P8E7N2_PUNGR|nr:uncharacterized protein LOC116214716 isoform X2 [Punica granatum]
MFDLTVLNSDPNPIINLWGLLLLSLCRIHPGPRACARRYLQIFPQRLCHCCTSRTRLELRIQCIEYPRYYQRIPHRAQLGWPSGGLGTDPSTIPTLFLAINAVIMALDHRSLAVKETAGGESQPQQETDVFGVPLAEVTVILEPDKKVFNNDSRLLTKDDEITSLRNK